MTVDLSINHEIALLLHRSNEKFHCGDADCLGNAVCLNLNGHETCICKGGRYGEKCEFLTSTGLQNNDNSLIVLLFILIICLIVVSIAVGYYRYELIRLKNKTKTQLKKVDTKTNDCYSLNIAKAAEQGLRKQLLKKEPIQNQENQRSGSI